MTTSALVFVERMEEIKLNFKLKILSQKVLLTCSIEFSAWLLFSKVLYQKNKLTFFLSMHGLIRHAKCEYISIYTQTVPRQTFKDAIGVCQTNCDP